MANLQVDKGIIYVRPVRRGFQLSFQPDGGKEFPLRYKPADDKLNEMRGELTRHAGKVVKLVTESGEIVFETPTSSSPTGEKGNVNPHAVVSDSFQINNTLLPRATKKAMANLTEPDNFYLKLYKCARFDFKKKDKFYFFKADKGIVEFSIKANFDKIDLAAIHSRNLKVIRAIGFSNKAGFRARLDVAADWRWIVGLGNASVYENGMTLHHVYGIPYIPGSGVKGMVRTWIINECFGHEKDSEEKALKNPLFKVIFGHGKLGDVEGQRGSIYFFDAFPTELPRIEPDVMNNHYQDYYEGKTPPADWLQPNPIFFLSVKGGKYRFQLGFKPGENGKEKIDSFGQIEALTSERFNGRISAQSSLLDLTEAWLKDALEHHGIGAKTAVGYGLMQ
jgi:CRISPR-associated protein Cmr6